MASGGIFTTWSFTSCLGYHNCEGVKCSTFQLVIQNGRLFRKLANMALHVVWANDRAGLLRETHLDDNHCGAHQLIKSFFGQLGGLEFRLLINSRYGYVTFSNVSYELILLRLASLDH